MAYEAAAEQRAAGWDAPSPALSKRDKAEAKAQQKAERQADQEAAQRQQDAADDLVLNERPEAGHARRQSLRDATGVERSMPL